MTTKIKATGIDLLLNDLQIEFGNHLTIDQ